MLKLAKPTAPRKACLRRSGSARSTPGIETTTARQASGSGGRCAGSDSLRTSASSAIKTAAPANVARQPIAAARRPLTVRDSRIPAKRPVITAPMAAPRSSRSTSPTAKGTAICGRQQLNPSTALASTSSA